ncbi:MAG TPA: caspase family protein [Ohtaekwangia sp.]|nr:caspase family protein [Ohtaekwangia sp.]
MKTLKITSGIFFLLCHVACIGQFKLYEKGYDSYKQGKYEESSRYLSEYLTKGTRDKAIDVEVFYIRALSYYKVNKFDKAIPDFEETILRNHPNKGNIYWFLAKCHVQLGEKQEGIDHYNSAIRELGSNNQIKARLLFERSQIHTSLGNLLLAYEDLKEGKSADPNNDDIAKEISKVEKQTTLASRTPENAKKDATGTPKKKEQTNSKKQPVVVAKKDNTVPAVSTVQTASPATVSNAVQTPVVTQPTLADVYKDEKRYALVIGNSKYSKDIGELRNPVNDATDMAAELKASNFDVQLLTNATYGQIRVALLKFKDKIDGGNKDNTVALFYYAGHGLLFEDENYLVPVDASVEYQDDIPRYCFPIQRMVLSNMERSNSRMNIVILDACRNNPFPAVHRSIGGGLGEMRRARGSFIAYATAPGSVASDGKGRNGLYTQELLKSMKKPGLTIEQVFKDVRANVLKLSDDKQNTWDSSNIIGEFYFKF